MRTLRDEKNRERPRRTLLYISIAALVLVISGWMLAGGVGEPPFLLRVAWLVSAAGIFLYYRDGGGKEGFLRDLAYAVWTVCVIVLFAYSTSATWPVMVAIESGSMMPNMEPGDLVFILGSARTDIVTYAEGAETGYRAFNNYGDVIIYKPKGDAGRTPIIHRAMFFVNKNGTMPNGERAPYDGYITQGDHNKEIFLDKYRMVSNSITNKSGTLCSPASGRIECSYDVEYDPVKPEWIVGVAKFRTPFIGCVSVWLLSHKSCPSA
jgi:signal peptidase